VRKKNVNNTMLKNLLDACGAAIAFYALGWGFAYGGTDPDASTFIGNSQFFLQGDVDAGTFFYQVSDCVGLRSNPR
jgi:Amt family ammonium transporter